MNTSKFVLYFLMATTALLLGCEKRQERVHTELKLQLNWRPEPQFGGFYAAAETGTFKRYGFDVEIVPGAVGTPGIQMVGSGAVPFAIVSADEIVIARAGGNNVKAVFAAFQTDPHAIMVHEARGFETLADVIRGGGTLGIQSGYPYALILKKKFGFEHLKIVPSPGGDLSSFRNDRNFSQQCFVTSEPILARRMGLDPQTFLIADIGYNPYTTVLATRDEFLIRHPDVVRKMVQACREGWRAYLADPKETNRVIATLNPSMDPDVLAESAEAQRQLIEDDHTRSAGLGSMARERWAELAQQLVEVGVIDRAPPADECFVDPATLLK